jgi:MFS family permease
MQPVGAGLAMLPMSVAAFLVAGTIGRYLHSVPSRLTIGLGLVVIGVGGLLLDAGASWVSILPGLAVTGIGVGVTGQALPGAMMATVPPSRAGMAAGALNTFRQLGMALGIAVLGTVVRNGSSFTAGLQGSYVVAGIVGVTVGVLALALIRSGDAVHNAEVKEVLRAQS